MSIVCRIGIAVSKLLCYELNEVPWRVVDHYVKERPKSNLAKLLQRSAQFTTRTVDGGELHPWSTWPTVHRGVSNAVHNIHSLNQDLSPAKKYPPIWELLTQGGRSCGIFGSLQSYPPVAHEQMMFHIPDTFAAGSSTIPTRCEPFQAFNLMQTGENKAVASSIGVGQIPMALGMLRSGIKPLTYLKVAKHLLDERRNASYKKRRALLQPELAFDVFLSCLKKYQPDYVTFFSNHVAGVMHRYWKYTFPEDFDYTLSDSGEDQFHRETLMVAMDMFDSQLGKLVKVSKRYGYDVVVMSSMGQEAIERGEYIPEIKLDSLEKLLQRIGINYTVNQNLAMQPDVAFEFDSIENMEHFQSALYSLHDANDNPIFKQRYAPVGLTLNVTIRSSKAVAADKHIYFHDEKIPLAELGLGLMERDIGTGYHQPEGILIWENFESNIPSRSVIDSRSILPTLLKNFGVPTAAYMQPGVSRETQMPEPHPEMVLNT